MHAALSCIIQLIIIRVSAVEICSTKNELSLLIKIAARMHIGVGISAVKLPELQFDPVVWTGKFRHRKLVCEGQREVFMVN